MPSHFESLSARYVDAREEVLALKETRKLSIDACCLADEERARKERDTALGYLVAAGLAIGQPCWKRLAPAEDPWAEGSTVRLLRPDEWCEHCRESARLTDEIRSVNNRANALYGCMKRARAKSSAGNSDAERLLIGLAATLNVIARHTKVVERWPCKWKGYHETYDPVPDGPMECYLNDYEEACDNCKKARYHRGVIAIAKGHRRTIRRKMLALGRSML